MYLICEELKEFQISLPHDHKCIILSVEKDLVEPIQAKSSLLINFLSLFQGVDGILRFLKIPMYDLIFRSICESDDELRIANFSAIECKRYKLRSLDVGVGDGERLLSFARVQINDTYDWHAVGLLRPRQISFILALSDCSNTFRPQQRVDEVLNFFIFERGTEIIKHDSIGCREDQFVFFGVANIQKQRVLILAVVMRDVFLDYRIFKCGRRLFQFQTGVHCVTY